MVLGDLKMFEVGRKLSRKQRKDGLLPRLKEINLSCVKRDQGPPSVEAMEMICNDATSTCEAFV